MVNVAIKAKQALRDLVVGGDPGLVVILIGVLVRSVGCCESSPETGVDVPELEKAGRSENEGREEISPIDPSGERTGEVKPTGSMKREVGENMDAGLLPSLEKEINTGRRESVNRR